MGKIEHRVGKVRNKIENGCHHGRKKRGKYKEKSKIILVIQKRFCLRKRSQHKLRKEKSALQKQKWMKRHNEEESQRVWFHLGDVESCGTGKVNTSLLYSKAKRGR